MNSNRMAERLVENIRRICREKDVSIMRMESDLGFSSGLISRWNKTKTCPSFDKIVDIMEYLGVTIDELMENVQSSNFRKQESPEEEEYKDDDVMIQLEKGSINGAVSWKRAGENMSFEVKADSIFPDMLCYDMHRIYYAAYKSGWFLLSVQYNEETADVLVAVYLLVAVGRDVVKLDASEANVMELLRLADEEIFKRMNQAQVDKMKEDFLGEDFQSRYRSVS